jgi:hypothetical protein
MPKPAGRALRFREREATRRRTGNRRQNPFRDTGAKNRAARGGGSLARGQWVWLPTRSYLPLTSKGLGEERDAAPSFAHPSPKPALQTANSDRSRIFPASASPRTIALDDSEHLLHSHPVSFAALRLLFTLAPERRSASFQNRCSPSPECPLTSFWDNCSGGSGHEGAKRENETRDWETFQQKLVELHTKIGKRALPWTRQRRMGSDCHLERSGKRAMWFFDYYQLITRIGPAVQTFAGDKAPEFSFVVRDSFEDQ